MSEFLQNSGFFILVLLLFLGCHLLHFGGHGGHGRGRDDDREKKDPRPGAGGHQH